MTEFENAWMDEAERLRWFQAGRGSKCGIALEMLAQQVISGRYMGKTALVEQQLREHIAQRGPKSVMICSSTPQGEELRRRLGLPEPAPSTTSTVSLFDYVASFDRGPWA